MNHSSNVSCPLSSTEKMNRENNSNKRKNINNDKNTICKKNSDQFFSKKYYLKNGIVVIV